MFDKLLVRVRSWLHAGNAPAAAGATALSAAEYRADRRPPPLPPDAWMESETGKSESGMVITESGIIIIDPALADAPANSAPPPPPRGVPADRAWAMPTMPRAGVGSSAAPPKPAPRSITPGEELDWDEVLARARAQIVTTPATPLPPSTPRAANTPTPPATPGRGAGKTPPPARLTSATTASAAPATQRSSQASKSASAQGATPTAASAVQGSPTGKNAKAKPESGRGGRSRRK